MKNILLTYFNIRLAKRIFKLNARQKLLEVDTTSAFWNPFKVLNTNQLFRWDIFSLLMEAEEIYPMDWNQQMQIAAWIVSENKQPVLTFARPPCSWTQIFDGFKSAWTMPSLCRKPSPRRISWVTLLVQSGLIPLKCDSITCQIQQNNMFCTTMIIQFKATKRPISTLPSSLGIALLPHRNIFVVFVQAINQTVPLIKGMSRASEEEKLPSPIKNYWTWDLCLSWTMLYNCTAGQANSARHRQYHLFTGTGRECFKIEVSW